MAVTSRDIGVLGEPEGSFVRDTARGGTERVTGCMRDRSDSTAEASPWEGVEIGGVIDDEASGRRLEKVGFNWAGIETTGAGAWSPVVAILTEVVSAPRLDASGAAIRMGICCSIACGTAQDEAERTSVARPAYRAGSTAGGRPRDGFEIGGVIDDQASGRRLEKFGFTSSGIETTGVGACSSVGAKSTEMISARRLGASGGDRRTAAIWSIGCVTAPGEAERMSTAKPAYRAGWTAEGRPRDGVEIGEVIDGEASGRRLTETVFHSPTIEAARGGVGSSIGTTAGAAAISARIGDFGATLIKLGALAGPTTVCCRDARGAADVAADPVTIGDVAATSGGVKRGGVGEGDGGIARAGGSDAIATSPGCGTTSRRIGRDRGSATGVMPGEMLTAVGREGRGSAMLSDKGSDRGVGVSIAPVAAASTADDGCPTALSRTASICVRSISAAVFDIIGATS